MSTNTSGHKKVWDIIPQDTDERYGHHYREAPRPFVNVPALTDFMDEPKFPAQADPANVACRFKWDYPIVNLMSGHIRTCCRVPKQVITEQDIDQGYPYTVTDVQKWYVDKIPSDPEQLPFNHPLLRADRPEMLEIILGNHCDLKCTYCSIHYSTQWQSELIKFGDIKKEDLKEHFPAAPEKLEKVFWEWFYDVGRHTSKVINILGGEPTYMPKFYDVMEKLTAAYKDLGKKDRHVELGILSNMNTKPLQMDRFLNLLPELTKYVFLRLQPSIEALDKKAEYIRYGLDWNRFEGNIRRILSERDKYGLTPDNFGMGFQMALNSFSISSLPEFVHWTNSLINEYDFEIGLMKNVVSFPRHHNPHVLTPDFGGYIEEARDYIEIFAEKNDRQIRGLMKKHTGLVAHGSWISYNRDLLDGLAKSVSSHERSQFDIDSRAHWYHFVEQMKTRRGADVLNHYPEMTDFYNLCKKYAGV